MTELTINPGKYVIAVSGGIDSVVLLHILHNIPDIDLVVAHYDHGIREDSGEDRRFVQEAARQYNLPFYYEEANLGSLTSEALAREKRYEFLRRVQKQTAAQGIITAHHQDDLIETAIINMFMGTGRRGLSALQSKPDLVRPLLSVPKKDIEFYARKHGLKWREDVTNQDDRYLRNYVRHHVVTLMTTSQRQELLSLLGNAKLQNVLIDNLLKEQLTHHSTKKTLNRAWFVSLPYRVAREVLVEWLRNAGIKEINRKQIERLTVLLKTLPRGKLVDVDAASQLKIETDKLALVPRER